MEDNRLECHPDCQCTHDVNNKCDGHCPQDTPDYETRLQEAILYEESKK